MIEDWCQQYPSHSIGALAFGRDGNLYVSGGDGASFNCVDYGQDGGRSTPAAIRPAAWRTVTPTRAAPCAARTYARRRTRLRSTGRCCASTPTPARAARQSVARSTDANARRIIAYGLRNPFRITTRPGTNEVWLGDVGWNEWEEIN